MANMKFAAISAILATTLISVHAGVIADDGAEPLAEFSPQQVTYHLYTRSNPDTPVEMYVGFLNNAPIDFAKQTKLVVHGYDENQNERYVKTIRENYMKVRDYNVIIVDWQTPASGSYSNAQGHTKPAGETIGRFIDYLGSQGGDLSMMHCIGFDLGAHACGFAGKIQNTTKLGRVTGLDPSKDRFDYGQPNTLLHQTDASFVDVIHTCGDWYSFWETLGHADFYPNNGKSEQPNCGAEVLSGTCSHGRSHEYFAESIVSGGFTGLLCADYKTFLNGDCDLNDEAHMGEPCITSARGSYFLETRGESPYAMG